MVFPQVAKGDWQENLADMFNFRMEAPKPLTRRHLMTEVGERVNFRGEVLTPLNEDDVRQAVAHLKKHDVKTIAVCLLFSYLYPEHERRIAEIIAEEYPEADVSMSHSVLAARGEVDRWSTTMFSAYVSPTVKGYLTKVHDLLREEGLTGELVFMQSNGGVATPEIVAECPATLLLSGPAAGPPLGLVVGEQYGVDNVLTMDMGGTSFDVGVVSDGVVNIVQQQILDAKKFSLPSVDVTAIGAGGGSIAWIDPAGRLQVGPQSAGAKPGPACYGEGDAPTVTDADLVLGFIDPNFFLGGEIKLDKELAEKAIRGKIAEPLGLSVTEAALAMYEIVNTNMASAIDLAFTKRGHDPRDFTICAAGGAAPVHAVRIMQELGIDNLIIPKVAPTYCAYGMLFCDLKHDFTQAYLCETDKADLGRINELYEIMKKEAVDTLRREGADEKDITIVKSMDVRYYGQIRERNASTPEGPVTPESLQATAENFHIQHRKTIGYSDRTYPTEIVRLHLSGIAKVMRPPLKQIEQGSSDASRALKGTRMALFSANDDFIDTCVYDGDKLLAGNVLEGPCIVEETMTTVVIPPDTTMFVDAWGNYATTTPRG
jgi:N-methylhydantoinase A